MAKAGAAVIRVFNYGSNSTVQLAGRVGNPKLRTLPAFLPDYSRVFCLQSRGWESGGVASISPNAGDVIYGSVAELTPKEKAALDQYEGSYREEKVTVVVGRPGDSQKRVEAIAYVAGSACERAFTEPLTTRPSEAYLTAIHVMLREHWPDDCDTIAIRGCQADGSIAEHDQWTHPGCSELGLGGLCVEMNAMRDEKETMPTIIPSFRRALDTIGITSAKDVAGLLTRADNGTAADKLEKSCRAQGLGAGTITALRQLHLHKLFVYGTLLTGECNHHVMTGARLVKPSAATAQADFVMLHDRSLPYPYALEHKVMVEREDVMPTRLVGEVYAVSDDHLQRHGLGGCSIDDLEGFPDLYNRIPITLDGGGAALLYVLADAETIQEGVENSEGNFLEVFRGDWRTHRVQQTAQVE